MSALPHASPKQLHNGEQGIPALVPTSMDTSNFTIARNDVPFDHFIGDMMFLSFSGPDGNSAAIGSMLWDPFHSRAIVALLSQVMASWFAWNLKVLSSSPHWSLN